MKNNLESSCFSDGREEDGGLLRNKTPAEDDGITVVSNDNWDHTKDINPPLNRTELGPPPEGAKLAEETEETEDHQHNENCKH